MRLLNVKTLRLESFVGDETPPYAILSHTWGIDEVGFTDIQWPDGPPSTGAGITKVKGCCKRALDDGFSYVWIDTCCIDKSSSTELSEAINSMYRWYAQAQVCYAHLADVPPGDINEEESRCHDAFRNSRWFTRGWTLQELLAPERLEFFSQNWSWIGGKGAAVAIISRVTGIDTTILTRHRWSEPCVAERMSWAADRRVTREEDIAYCLMGIFGVHMPLIYGEGRVNAFRRLQEELIKISADPSLFAWDPTPVEIESRKHGATTGMLAESPANFKRGRGMRLARFTSDRHPISKQNGLIYTNLTLSSWEASHMTDGEVFYGVLSCQYRDDVSHALTIPLIRREGVFYRVQKLTSTFDFGKRYPSKLTSMPARLSAEKGAPEVANTDAFLAFCLPIGYRVSHIHPETSALSGSHLRIIATGLTLQDLIHGKKKHNRPSTVAIVLASTDQGYPMLPHLLIRLQLEQRWLQHSIVTAETREVPTSNPVPISDVMANPIHHFDRAPLSKVKINSTVSVQQLACGTCFVVDVFEGSLTWKRLEPVFQKFCFLGFIIFLVCYWGGLLVVLLTIAFSAPLWLAFLEVSCLMTYVLVHIFEFSCSS